MCRNKSKSNFATDGAPYCQYVYRNPQTAKLEISPACQRHIGVIFADMEIDYDKLAAAILSSAKTAAFCCSCMMLLY